MSEKTSLVIEREQLQALLDALHARGFPTIGPTLQDGSIVYDELKSIDDLPAGWSDRQEAGTYRLARREDGALFGYNVGPHSWKRFLHPPVLRLLQVESVGGNLAFTQGEPAAPTCAFIGVRACEVQAMAIQDRVFLDGEYSDPDYRSRRERAFVVAVDCGQAGGTCFCASMGTGPKVTGGFDLSLTEIVGPEGHRFVVETGSERGAELMREILIETPRRRSWIRRSGSCAEPRSRWAGRWRRPASRTCSIATATTRAGRRSPPDV